MFFDISNINFLNGIFITRNRMRISSANKKFFIYYKRDNSHSTQIHNYDLDFTDETPIV